jgi:5-formyltetrahydrofolate cyclo-ligase
VDPSLAACILIPALACDRSGTRLGYGQGFYDRFLVQVGGLRVAVIPEQGLVETLPRDPWDVPMEVIVTESQIVRI